MDLMQAFTEKHLRNRAPKVRHRRHRPYPHPGQGRQPRAYSRSSGGTVIAKHGGIEETFTLRRISYGVGVKKVFPVPLPPSKIEVIRHGLKSAGRSSTTCAKRVGKRQDQGEAMVHDTKKRRLPLFLLLSGMRKWGGPPFFSAIYCV